MAYIKQRTRGCCHPLLQSNIIVGHRPVIRATIGAWPNGMPIPDRCARLVIVYEPGPPAAPV